MKEVKTPFSIKLIYWLTNAIMGLLGLVFILALAYNVAVFTGHMIEESTVQVSLPVKLDVDQTGLLSVMGKEVPVKVVEAEGQIQLINPPATLVKFISVSLLFLILGAMYLLCQFRGIVKNVRNGSVFDLENIKLLKKIAYILTGFWFAMIVYAQAGKHIAMEHLAIDGVIITSETVSNSNLLTQALCLWVLAHIFSTGLELKEEQSLTI